MNKGKFEQIHKIATMMRISAAQNLMLGYMKYVLDSLKEAPEVRVGGSSRFHGTYELLFNVFEVC